MLLVTVIIAVGIVVVRSTSQVLTTQVDNALTEIQERAERPEREPPGVQPSPGDDTEERLVGHFVIDAQGNVLVEDPSGFADDPDPVPDLTGIDQLLLSGDIQTIPSEDGSMSYRAFARLDAIGFVEVFTAPLDEVEDAVGAIVRTLALTGAGVAILGAAVTWWTVYRGLEPVDQMVDTAAAIAAGDLTERIPESKSSTELDRLGAALNDMLYQIEESFTREHDAQERLRAFVADASHELRTPVAAIKGYSELYQKGALTEQEDLDNAIRRIGRESSRMERLIADLLLLARLDRGQSLEFREVNLAAIVRDAAIDSQAIDPGRPVTVSVPETVLVNGDEEKLIQVVSNLLANARTHTPAGTPVTITVDDTSDQVRLDVVDDGPGFPDGVGDEVFDRFYRIDDSRARSTGGTGLGLAIVAAIVQAHGGTVEAANEEGHGARLTITLEAA